MDDQNTKLRNHINNHEQYRTEEVTREEYKKQPQTRNYEERDYDGVEHGPQDASNAGK